MPRAKRLISQELSDQLEVVRARARAARTLLAEGSTGRAVADIVGGRPPASFVAGHGITLEAFIAVLTAPSAPLELVAWLAEIDGESHDRTVLAIDAAQDARFQWVEIAEALGLDSGDDKTVTNLAKRHRLRRNELLQRH